jgi:hypothetical protein
MPKHRVREYPNSQPCKREGELVRDRNGNYTTVHGPAKYIRNPYRWDVWDEEVMEWMCDHCYHETLMDI